MIKTDLREAIERKIDLPSVPAVIHQVNLLLEQEEIGSIEVARIVETDQSFVARILKIVNSPFYGIVRPVTSVQEAIAILGVEALCQLLTATTVLKVLRLDSRVLDLNQFWLHSFGVGSLAKNLLDHHEESIRQEAFLCGVLHDIGRLIMINSDSDKYLTLYERGESATDLEKEERWFGINHQEAGALLAKKWNFPESIINVISCHHLPEEAPDDCLLTAAVSIADLLCHALSVGDSGAQYVSHFSPAAWHRLGLTMADLKIRIKNALKEINQTTCLLNDMHLHQPNGKQ